MWFNACFVRIYGYVCIYAYVCVFMCVGYCSARFAVDGGGVSLFRLFDPSTGAALAQPEEITSTLLRSQQAADDYGTYIMLEPSTGKVGCSHRGRLRTAWHGLANRRVFFLLKP